MSYTFNKFITSDDNVDEFVAVAEVQIAKINDDVKTLNDTQQQNNQDISILEQKTLYISDQLSVDGTVFVNNVYSEAFVKNGGTSTQYLMADGSTTTNSQQGQPNIYLYNNNNSGTPEPASGQIRANDPNNQNVTELYISHITSDGIDIDVFLQQISTLSIIYLQDRNNSNNNVRFNVTGAIIDNPNLYVTVPVSFDIAQGTGSIDFGDGHPLFMSIFDNSQLIDSRISAVETKTQHQSATSLETRFNSPINMFDHKIYNVADPVDLNDVSTKKYVDDAVVNLNTSVVTLENKTQNQTGSAFATIFDKNFRVRIADGSADSFTVTNNDSPLPLLRFLVGQDSVQIYLPLIMAFENRIESLGDPVNPKDATTKSYVDTADALKLNLTGGTLTGSITATQFIRTGGATTQFLKANGDIDGSTYITATNSVITDLQNKTQNITANGTITTIEKSAQFRLSNSNTFSISDDGDPFAATKLLVTNSQINAQIPMSMNTYKLNGIPTPTNNDDAVNKVYVDNRISSLSGTYATITQLSSVANNVDTKLSLSGGFVNGNIIMQTGDLSLQNGNLDMGSNLLVNVGTLAVNDSISILSGNSGDFMKSDGSTDTNRYLNLNGSTPMTGTLAMGNNSISGVSSISLQDGTFRDFLMADGGVSANQNLIGDRLNKLYYNPTTGTTSYSLNMDSWRYQSWGYVAPAVVSVVDCVTGLMANLGGSLGNLGINAGIAPKGYKVRVNSNVSSTTNGATCGWLGSALQNYLIPRGGWYIKIGFSLDATTGAGTNRTMIGLFQSNTRPTLDNTTTIASITTGSMGIVQEKGETVFSFNTRGTSGSTKIPTTISCETPNNNWYTLEMINEPDSLRITLILTCQRSGLATQTQSASFICGGANTMPDLTSFVHLQQSMASPGGINGSALLSLGNITTKIAQ